jgi:anaerobic magnesium-protoporphyrin IX monomethyl ester cyclase
MKSPVIVFIGLKEYDNLGLGYMSAVLKENGFVTRTLDINRKRTEILSSVQKQNPLLIGFSVIYLHHLKKFRDLSEYLRKSGLKCHFTAGGHYASFKYNDLMTLMPELDSVVRFEGENTILELASYLRDGKKWKNIKGLAYRDIHNIISNELRPFEKDLDKFPYPVRSALKPYAFWKKFAALIAGRGCVHDCSFCNTGSFYRQANGKAKRIRKPDLVVKEMEMLYRTKNCDIFLFLDDDFPVSSGNKSNWITEYCEELERNCLSDKILWKISCRPDEVKEELFGKLKKHGLFSVFIGLEDGTDAGLKQMNKNVTVDESLKAVAILKKLRIRFNFGFMMFNPYTTFKTLNENIHFLNKLCNDGYTPVTFLKMLPFYETRIEKDLIKEGRLISGGEIPDYEFLETSMNGYYKFICECTDEWLYSPDGLENIANWAYNYISVCKKFFSVQPYIRSRVQQIRRCIASSNKFLLDSMNELSEYFENELYKKDDGGSYLNSCKENISANHAYYRSQIIRTMSDLISIAEEYQLKNHLLAIKKLSEELKLCN